MDWIWGWSAVGAIATCLLVAGVFLAFVQIRRARLSTNAEIAIELFRELREPYTLKIIRDIYELIPDNFTEFTQGQRDEIDHLTDRFNLLGGLVFRKIIDHHLAITIYGGPAILRCWYQLSRYIRNEQQTRCYYIEDYEDLVNRTWKYFDHERIRVGFSPTQGEPVEDLIQLFNQYELDKNLKNICPRSMKKIKQARRRNRRETTRRN